MNERIQELAIRAAGKGFQTFATSDFDSQEKIERFAELIVRECARVANENVGAFTPGCGNSVLEHFGVEQE